MIERPILFTLLLPSSNVQVDVDKRVESGPERYHVSVVLMFVMLLTMFLHFLLINCLLCRPDVRHHIYLFRFLSEPFRCAYFLEKLNM